MRGRLVTLAATVIAPLLSLCALAQAPARVTARTVHVVVKDFTHTGCGDCGAFFGGGILGLEDRHRIESVAQQFEFLEAEIPGLNIRASLQEAFCRELAGSSDPACLDVVIHDRVPSREGARVPVGPNGILVIAVAIEYMHGIGPDGFRIIASVAEPKAAGLTEPFLQLWYMTPPPKRIDGTPMVAASAANAKQKVSREYWWAGTPSRIETEIRRGITDIAGIARVAIPRLGPDAADGESENWWSSLPPVSELKAAGKTNCRGVMCTFKYLGVSDDRYWWAQPGVPTVIMSTPLVPEN